MIRPFASFFALITVWPALTCAQTDQVQATATGSQQASIPVPGDTQTSPAPPAKPKKVWTNEDIKGAGSVSVIGDSRNQKYTMTKAADPATVAKYRNNLQKLQGQLAEVNEKIQAYEDFEAGKPVAKGGKDPNRGYNRTPVEQQLSTLQDKKRSLEVQIDALYEDARKHGIESGQLK